MVLCLLFSATSTLGVIIMKELITGKKESFSSKNTKTELEKPGKSSDDNTHEESLKTENALKIDTPKNRLYKKRNRK